ncbi:MAG: tetratricopeptide repeat protein [Tuberibacillus sp.]
MNIRDMSLNEVLDLAKSYPEDASIQLECAFYCDSNGFEEEAAPLYIKAIQLGLPEDKMKKAYNNLGSTYRVLGRHEEALNILNEGLERFQDFRPLNLFKALTLYDLGRQGEAMDVVIAQLLETTEDADILYYKRALSYYANELKETDS